VRGREKKEKDRGRKERKTRIESKREIEKGKRARDKLET